MRLCDSKEWSRILSTILRTDIVIISDYKTESKTIGELYGEFKKKYKLPINYFEQIKACKYLNFYYSPREKEEYLNLWKMKTCEPFVSYTAEEYKFYIRLCLENQTINDIQEEQGRTYCRCPKACAKFIDLRQQTSHRR